MRLLNSAAIPLVLCMGATFIILMGSIDLSVEGVVALTAVIASLLVANDITDHRDRPVRGAARRSRRRRSWASLNGFFMSSSRPRPS